jgi:hypothetical protein
MKIAVLCAEKQVSYSLVFQTHKELRYDVDVRVDIKLNQ